MTSKEQQRRRLPTETKRTPEASPLKSGEARSGDCAPILDALSNDDHLQFEALEAAISARLSIAWSRD